MISSPEELNKILLRINEARSDENKKQKFDEQPSVRKMRLCKDMIIKKLSKNNAINDRDLEVYVDRIIQNLTEDQLTDMEQTPGIYVLKINKKVNSHKLVVKQKG